MTLARGPAPSRVGAPTRISGAGWATGFLSWGLLLIGAPLSSMAFIGCIGMALLLGSLVLGIGFLGLSLRGTSGSSSRWRAAGLILVLAGMVAVGWSAWTSLAVFDKGHAAGVNPVAGLFWAAAGLCLGGGLVLLGEGSKVWVTVASLCAGGTGPILTAVCHYLASEGWRSGN